MNCLPPSFLCFLLAPIPECLTHALSQGRRSDGHSPALPAPGSQSRCRPVPRGSKRPKGQEDFLEEAALALRSKAWRPGSMWGSLETQPREEEPGDLFTPERCAAQPTDPRALMRDLNVVPMALGSYGRFWRGRIRFMLRGSLQS